MDLIDIECDQNTDTSENKCDDDSMMDVSELRCYEDISDVKCDDMEISDLRNYESTDLDSESEFYVTVDS